MTPAKLENYKKRLIEQFDTVTTEIKDHLDRDTPAGSEVENAILSSEDKLLEKIEFALQRIEDGSYGKCGTCGSEISTQRLEAKPAVSLCTGCQEEKERAERSN